MIGVSKTTGICFAARNQTRPHQLHTFQGFRISEGHEPKQFRPSATFMNIDAYSFFLFFENLAMMLSRSPTETTKQDNF